MLRGVVLNLETRVKFNHNENLPNSFRMLILGSSVAGKTSLLLQLLLEPGFIDYNALYIFSAIPSQQEYILLLHGFSNGLSKEQIASIALNQDSFRGVPIPILCKKFAELASPQTVANSFAQSTSPITVQLSNKVNEIPLPEHLDKSMKNIIVFDDVINSLNQNTMSEYYSRSRHHSCNCIYLSQSYFDLPRIIRLNSNFIIIFKLSKHNLNDMYNSAVGTLVEKNNFISMAENVWAKKYSYIAINKENDKIITDLFDESKNEYSQEAITA